MSTLQERLQKFLIYEDISMRAFERQCDIKAGTASKMTEKSYGTTFHRIGNAFPQLNIDWLKTGDGEMLKQPPTIDMSRHNSPGGTDVYGDIFKIGDAKYMLDEAAKLCILEKEVENLRQFLKEKERIIQDKDRRIKEKDERIQELKERIEELKAQKR